MNKAEALRGKAAIIGLGQAGTGEMPGHSPLEILALSVKAALDDCGLKLSDIDGLFTGSSYHFLPTVSVAEYLGIKPRFFRWQHDRRLHFRGACAACSHGA